MTAILRLALVVFSTGAMGGLIWFAHRAGWNGATARCANRAIGGALAETAVMHSMAEVSGEEITDEVMLKRLEEGTG